MARVAARKGASADIWLGRFDGSKYVPPAGAQEPEGDQAAPPPRHEPEDQAAPRHEPEVRKAAAPAPASLQRDAPKAAPVHAVDGSVLCHVETPEKAHEALREARELCGPAERLDLIRNNERLLTRLAQRRDDAGKWSREQLETLKLALVA